MNLHEYQDKSLFSKYHIPVANSVNMRHTDERTEIQARLRACAKKCEVILKRALSDDRSIIKVQAHAGGRGMGGDSVVDSPAATSTGIETLLEV